MALVGVAMILDGCAACDKGSPEEEEETADASSVMGDGGTTTADGSSTTDAGGRADGGGLIPDAATQTPDAHAVTTDGSVPVDASVGRDAGSADVGTGLPDLPVNWEVPLNLSSLPALQLHLGGDTTSSWVYANSVLGAEVWMVGDVDGQGSNMDDHTANPQIYNVPLTETGWPRALPDGYRVRISGDLSVKTRPNPGEYWSDQGYEAVQGIYIVTWQGGVTAEGRFQVLDSINDGHPELGTVVLPAGDHRIITKVRSPNRGVMVWYDHPDPNDPIRDVKIWTPLFNGAGAEVDLTVYDATTLGPGKLSANNTEPQPSDPDPRWHPRFLEHVRSSGAGVIRFMGFLNINALEDEPTVTWAERMPATSTLTSLVGVDSDNYHRHRADNFRSRIGIPYEWIFDLCNQVNMDAWVQVPHTSDASVWEGLGRLAASPQGGLEQTQRVWFEFSNELWNSAGAYLPQYNAAAAEGTQHGQNHSWGSGHLQGRALEIVERAFAAAGGMDDRLINVVAGFAVSPDYNRGVITGANAVKPGLAEVLAITTYFGADATASLYELPVGTGNPDLGVYEAARDVLRGYIYNTSPAWFANGTLAQENGLGLVAYEGGSHVLATGHGDWNNPQHAAFMHFLSRLHKHPVMKDLYLEHWGLWRAAGGLTAALFVDISGYSYWGYWGAKEDVTETAAEAPRWDAAQTYASREVGIRSMDERAGTFPIFTTSTQLMAEAGTAVNLVIQASGGQGPLEVELLGGFLPQGCVLGTATTGNTGNNVPTLSLPITGIPTRTEVARFVLRVVDQDGDASYGLYQIAVDPAGSSTGRLVLFDPTTLPLASLANSENREDYRSRYDPVTTRNDQTRGRIYFPFLADQPFFSHHYSNHSLTLPATSPFTPSVGMSLTVRETQFNNQGLHLQDGTPVVWDPQHDSSMMFNGLRNLEFQGWQGSSLDVPSGGDTERFGVPTDSDILMVWRREQMEAGATDRISFTAARSSLVMEFGGAGCDEVEIRFVIRNVGLDNVERYYLSEARHDSATAARFQLEDFDNNATLGKRWAEWSPTASSFAIPAQSLTYEAVDFENVTGVGLAMHLYRGGWHYGFSFSRFLAVGVKTP